jgi:hypothetical protein
MFANVIAAVKGKYMRQVQPPARPDLGDLHPHPHQRHPGLRLPAAIAAADFVRLPRKARHGGSAASGPWSRSRLPRHPGEGGVQRWLNLLNLLDSRLRGNDGYMGKGSQSDRVRDQCPHLSFIMK